jgi:hypothetical protein
VGPTHRFGHVYFSVFPLINFYFCRLNSSLNVVFFNDMCEYNCYLYQRLLRRRFKVVRSAPLHLQASLLELVGGLSHFNSFQLMYFVLKLPSSPPSWQCSRAPRRCWTGTRCRLARWHACQWRCYGTTASG